MSARVPGLRFCYIAAGMAVAAGAASSCLASGSIDELLACRRIEASAARLACFDRESGALATQRSAALAAPQSVAPATPQSDAPAVPQSSAPATPQAAVAAAPQTPAPSQPQLSPRETFGLAPQQIAERAEAVTHTPKPLDSLTAHIASITKAADGREIFILDNHQEWVQLQATGDWLAVDTGEQVTISRGWLGSYRLSLSSHRGFKVTRVR